MVNPPDSESIDNYLLDPEPAQGKELRETLSKRSDILQAVADEPLTKPQLIDIVDVSRSTIDRGTKSLESVDCVENRDGHYTATTKGEFALDEYLQYKRNTNSIDEGGDILNCLGNDVEMSKNFLRNMTVHSRNPHVPDAVLEYSNELLQSATRLTGLAPVALTSYPNLINNEIEERGMSVELVIEDSVLNSLQDLKADVLSDLCADEDVDLYIYEDSLPYAMWIMQHDDGETAGITVYDNGAVQGILSNDSPEEVDWAKDVCMEYRDQSIYPAEKV